MSESNKRQVAGSHYYNEGRMQHWDMVVEFDLDYFQGQITRYLFRWKDKNGIEDLEKCRHYIEKYIELVKKAQSEDAAAPAPKPSADDQKYDCGECGHALDAHNKFFGCSYVDDVAGICLCDLDEEGWESDGSEPFEGSD